MRGPYIAVIAGVVSIAACDRATTAPSHPSTPVVPTPVVPVTPVGGPTVVTPGPVSAVVLGAFPAAANFAGMRRYFSARAFDKNAVEVTTTGAVASVSDSGVALIEAQFPLKTTSGGRTWFTYHVQLRLVAEGSVVLRVHLGDKSDSTLISVRRLPPPTKALVVDSFEVVEFRMVCRQACSVLAYAPLIRLREPTGAAQVNVVGIQYTLGALSTALCYNKTVALTAGESGYVNGIDASDWYSNDIVFADRDWARLPDAIATATVITQDPLTGEYGTIEATGSIKRLPVLGDPVLPAPYGGMWLC